MRVTESTIAANFLANLNRSRARIVQLQSQLATGKRVLKPSDDPLATGTILRLNDAISRNEQFEKNVTDAQAMIETTGSSLDGFSNILLEVKEILVRVRNGAVADGLGIYADRIDQLLDEAVNIANTKFNGKYIFGGTNTLQQPFTLAPDRSAVTANPNGITGSIEYQVAEGLRQVVNIDGQEAFNGTQIFTALIQLRDQLQNGQIPSPADADQIDAMMEYVNNKGGKAGSIQTNLRSLEVRLLDQRLELTGLLSIHQDADFAEGALKLKHEESMLDAALAIGARLIPTSLLDFLK